VKTRRWLARLVALASVWPCAARAPQAAAGNDAWTPEGVRRFVLAVDRQMGQLYAERVRPAAGPLPGLCRGSAMTHAIERSRVVSRTAGFLVGPIQACYVATYLGCDAGPWIGVPRPSLVGPARRPFTRSKVTIVEQTRDRVVADVTEIRSEDFYDGEARVWIEDQDAARPYTDAEVDAVKDASRYTIVRGKDGRWRISDRKPGFAWVCAGASNPAPDGR
jgi:hypothetical protein